MPGRLLGELAQSLQAQHGSDPAWITQASLDDVLRQTEALEMRAAAHHDRAAALQALPLFGVPYAVKDNIDVAGWPTTAACPAFAYTPAADAATVARLRAAGAICMGKTNLDQFATGLVGTRSPYGRPASTFAPDRVSGGSSSGSAVTVASGQVAFALGTDTAGSGRVPAGFNHIVGLKPTPGRTSTRGVVPACRSLDCVSVFALTASDAAQVLALIEGADDADAYSRFEPGPARWPEQLRVGVPALPRFGTTPGYAPAWQAAVDHLRGLGHDVVEIDFAPLHATALLLYSGPWVAERHAVVQELLQRDPAAFDPVVRRVVEAAFGYSATDAFRGQYSLRATQRSVAAMWGPGDGRVDVLMVPTAPAHPSFAEVDSDPLGANAQLGHYTNFVNLLGWCALALPFGFTAERLPFGVTFIAPGNHDAALARFGVAWQDSLALSLGATGAAYREESPATGAAVWPAAAPTLPLAVVGAHLSGLPLNGQLSERGAWLREATHTAPHYRLYALPGTVPAKPGLQRVGSNDAGGASIAVEVWELQLAQVGSFLALVPPPLGLGSVELADGRWVHGFVCEAHALAQARDVTSFGGWRAYLKSLAPPG